MFGMPRDLATFQSLLSCIACCSVPDRYTVKICRRMESQPLQRFLALDRGNRVTSGPDELVDFAATSSRVWKIALRTQSTGSDAWMVVRGLRFFNDQGLEMFPAKQVPN
jgi:hypothetical protein